MTYFGALLMLSTLLVPVSATAQQSYPIVCQGGGNLYFNYTPFSNVSPAPQIWISFQRGQQMVGPNWENLSSLLPGQCAWLDRPVSDNEPDRIVVTNVVGFSVAWSHGQVMGISSELQHINNLQQAGRYQSFNVFNDGRGNFIVTAIDRSR